jgi:hypothetical protein
MSGTIAFGNGIHVNPNYWILKSWYKRHGKNLDKVNWLDAIHCNIELDEGKIKAIVENEKPDVICFGIYIWNYDLYSRLGKYIKENWPHIILIAGGPNVYAHKELNLFWNNNPWVDIAIYGDGEEAFTTVVDTIIDASTVTQQANNISYIANNEPILEPFKRFKNADFNIVSPFIDNVDDVKFSINQIKQVNPNFEIIFNWEFTKGCPYACSFCDWSSGLHHKVTRKEYDWKLDLDLFSELCVSVRWVDANVGMYKDDINIIKYSHQLETNNPKFKFVFNNLAKIQKKAVFEIVNYIESTQPGEKVHNFAVQDKNTDVLENIDRPDIPWDEYKNYIVQTKNNHPNFKFDFELILGLPGQSLQIFAENMIEYMSVRPNKLIGHLWCLLINSPSYNREYREKFDITVQPAYHVINIPNHLITRDSIFKNIDDCQYYLADTVISTNSASTADIIAMHGMTMLYNSLNHYKLIDLNVLNKVMLNLEYWQSYGTKMADLIENDLRQHQKILLAPELLPGNTTTFYDFFNDKKTLISIIKASYTK